MKTYPHSRKFHSLRTPTIHYKWKPLIILPSFIRIDNKKKKTIFLNFSLLLLNKDAPAPHASVLSLFIVICWAVNETTAILWNERNKKSGKWKWIQFSLRYCHLLEKYLHFTPYSLQDLYREIHRKYIAHLNYGFCTLLRLGDFLLRCRVFYFV